MSYLRPRIGKENEKPGERDPSRNDLEKLPGIGMNEVKVGETGAIAFTERPFDPFAHDIDPDAELIGVSGSVGRQVMSMSAADFPSERCRRSQKGAKVLNQFVPTLFHALAVFGRACCQPERDRSGIHLDRLPSPSRGQLHHKYTDICRINSTDPAGLPQGQRFDLG